MKCQTDNRMGQNKNQDYDIGSDIVTSGIADLEKNRFIITDISVKLGIFQ